MSGAGDWRQRLWGDRDRLGWWIVPLFAVVGLAGAVIAGSLTVVYYAQQVAQLEEETSAAREELTGTLEEVRGAGDEALAAIEEEVDTVQERLAAEPPLDDALEVGVARLEVDETLSPPPSAGSDQGTGGDPDPETGGSAGDDASGPGDGPADDAGDGAGGDGDGSDGAAGDGGDGQAGAPVVAAQRQGGGPVELRRAASGFVVAVDGDEAFLATTLGLVDDPRQDERVPADVAVTVRVAGGETTGTIHSWDAELDLVLVRAPLTGVEPLPWRPADEEPLEVGDRVTAVGASPALRPVRTAGRVAAVSDAALVTDLPDLELTAGGPVVDPSGRVVGVAPGGYAPLGADPVVLPVRRLCGGVLSSCPQ